jgi:outer membrane protein assembly factor BamE (lipoprotein component of BamABCDE complex)
MRYSVLILGLSLLLGGCAYQQGQRFNTQTVMQLKPGVSTEQDAIAQLGPPAARVNNDDGTQLLQWQYIYETSTSAVGNAHAAILFGSDQKMIKVVEAFQQ